MSADPANGLGGGAAPLSRSVDRQAEGCGKAEAGAVTLPTLAVHCSPDPGSGLGVGAI
ncbi:MAG TPA: hypothetical protein VFB38_11025 [Chthonomonadaceae bacterium]|nr:hypothetical protein [Chthonomonadaceae bacterium]